MIEAKFKKRIHSYVFVNERILQLRYKLKRGYLTLLAVYPQKLALTSPTGGGRSVGMVRSRTKATEFSLV